MIINCNEIRPRKIPVSSVAHPYGYFWALAQVEKDLSYRLFQAPGESGTKMFDSIAEATTYMKQFDYRILQIVIVPLEMVDAHDVWQICTGGQSWPSA
jgi:hypothetical protein